MTTPTAALHPPGALYEQAAQFRRDLGVMQDAAADQMLAAHSAAYQEMAREYVALMARVQAAQEAGHAFSPAWLYQRARLREALATTQEQIDRFAAVASATVRQAQAAAVQASAVHAFQMGRRAVQDSGVAAAFTAINPANLEHLVGFLADGSPVEALFTGMGADVAEQIRSALIRGIGLGKGVAWMRRQVETALDVPRWRAETIMRTESHRVYRSVARETYTANSSVLTGWVWVAALDARTCPCCVVMHGTEHPVEATLDGHPRCRCAMVPRTKTYDEILGLPPGTTPDGRPEFGSGKEWLQGQSETAQRAILGRGKYEAWKAGEVTLDDFVARTHDPDWGTMRRERSLREIHADQHANWHDSGPVQGGPPPLPATRAEAGAEAQRLAQDAAEAFFRKRRTSRMFREWFGYQQAFGDYNYREVNEALRGGGPDAAAHRKVWRDIFQGAGIELAEPIVLHRGIKADPYDSTDYREMFAVGDEYVDDGVSSTTASRGAARGWLSDYFRDDPASERSVLLELHVPAGVRIVGGSAGTFETMLAPGTRTRVHEIRDDTDVSGYVGTVRTIVLEVVP